MKTRMSRLLALLLTLAMLLPSMLTVMPARAEETVTELPTETIPVDSTVGSEGTPEFAQWGFTDATDLADFDLYQSGTSQFVVSNGMLMADGTNGEQKAIVNQDGPIESVSVNIIPGASGVIYGGLYFGAKNAQAGQDQINSHVILIKSDYTAWSDAPNRIDIIHGQFNGGWKQISTTISETGNGNNLFSGGVKQPLNLKLNFSDDVVLLTLSLVSNPARFVQLMYEVEPEELQGSVGLRSLGSDTCYDNLIVNEDYKPETLQQGLKLDGTGLDSYAKTVGGMTEKPVTIETWFKMEALAGGSQRQAIISNYTASGLGGNPVGTWGIYTDEYGKLWYTERSDAGHFNQVLSGIKLWTNVWTHMTLVRAQGVLHVYINGELKASVSNSGIGTVPSAANSLTIGYCTVGGGTGINSMKGEIGDIRMWSTERTQGQIQRDMYRELEGTEEGLIHHWNFDSQDHGVVYNNVTGGLNCELLGHTQIGNEDIRCWDFSQESQLEDFEETLGSESYSVTGGKLYVPAGAWYQFTLKEEIDNVTSVSVDVTHGAKALAWHGLEFGINDSGYIRVWMNRTRTSASKNPWSEVWMVDSSGTKLTSTTTHGSFFPGNNVKKDFCMRLDMTDNTVTAQMYRLDDPTIVNKQSCTLDADKIAGRVGLFTGNHEIYYDNFTVVSKIEQEELPTQEDETLYDNQGHVFAYESRPWKVTQDLTTTPYTLEAWIKIPKGVADGTAAYLVGNPDRAPGVCMQMINYGKLRLFCRMENDDLTVDTKIFDVDTDLRTGKWTHVAFTMDAATDTVVAYINGEAVQTWTNAGIAQFTMPDAQNDAPLFTVGSREMDNEAEFKLTGWIADMRIWDRALSASEIQNSMLTQYTEPQEGLLLNLPLDEMVDGVFVDLSGNNNNLQAYDSSMKLEAQTHEPGAYSMVVIPDQQILSHYYNTELQGMYQWIADNREKENIQIVMNVGDMADNCGNIAQWENNKAAWELLPDDLPFITVPGNHDYDTNSGWNKGYGVRSQLTIMNQYFPMSIFENYPTEFGALSRDQGVADNIANTYQAFEVNGNRYLIMALEYVPQADALAWANEVVEAHPYHQVILITHSYMGSYGNLDQPHVWNDFLKKHENVIMNFSGHVWSTAAVRRTDKGVNGNDVHQILMDAQFCDTGNQKVAMLGLLRFNADGTVCDVSYYSTSRDQYEVNSNFTLQLPKPANVTAQVGDDLYLTVTEAIANANGETVKILKDTDEAINISSDLTIDLAGCKLGNVTVAEGVKLNLIDSTADYSGTKGSATVTGSVERFTENGDDKFMVIGENGVYAPHKYYVGITHVSLDTSVTGFGYKAQFYGDEAVQAQIASIGYDLWLTEDRVVSRSMNKFQNVVTLRLKNFPVDTYGETLVNAKAIITLVDGTKLESSVNSYSMRSMIELLNDSCADFGVAQLQNVAMFIKKNPVMEGWNVANILAILQPAANVEAIAVTDQSMTLLDGTTGTFTLNGAYCFTAQDTEQTVAYSDYASWEADYYITMDKEAAEGLYLAGNYGSYGWIAIPVEAGNTYTAVPVVETLLGTSLTYEEMVTDVVSFSCGVADTQSLNTGAAVTVELRLTNPENPEESIVLNTTTLTLA